MVETDVGDVGSYASFLFVSRSGGLPERARMTMGGPGGPGGQMEAILSPRERMGNPFKIILRVPLVRKAA